MMLLVILLHMLMRPGVFLESHRRVFPNIITGADNMHMDYMLRKIARSRCNVGRHMGRKCFS